uniref:Nop domain-containing protein n=1 Tax=Chenopodium quinoa TaxID=63459 RepID=A0A803M9E4_CHEQI
MVNIEDSVYVLYAFIRDNYGRNFPEAESLVAHPIDYVCAVKKAGFEIVDEACDQVLDLVSLRKRLLVLWIAGCKAYGGSRRIEAIGEDDSVQCPAPGIPKEKSGWTFYAATLQLSSGVGYIANLSLGFDNRTNTTEGTPDSKALAGLSEKSLMPGESDSKSN